MSDPRRRCSAVLTTTPACLLVFLFAAGALSAETTVRISGDSDWDSLAPSISADGRYVAFASGASNLVTGAGHLVSDVFLYDREAGTIRCLSLTPNGGPGNGDSDSPAVSADGRYVAFRSYAPNLVGGDSNAVEDVFVRILRSGVTVRVSVGESGAQADSWSDSPSISADGRYIAFSSAAANLVPGDTNGVRDIFVHDLVAHQTSLVSRGPAGEPANGGSFAPSISGDGRSVAFSSNASNLVTGDLNGVSDVFLADRLTGTITCASVNGQNLPANSDSDSAAISADGKTVAFRSYASDLAPGDIPDTPDVFLYDGVSGAVSALSVNASGGLAGESGGSPSPSADGRYVAFVTRAALTPDDANGWEDVYVRDRVAGKTERVSVTAPGASGNYWSAEPSISQDGVYVAFASYASNLVAGDGNAMADVFIRGPIPALFTPADVATALRLAGGLWTATTFSLARLDVVSTGESAGRVDLDDAGRILRLALGLDG